MVQELQSYAVSEGEGKYETAVSHGYIGYGINVALAHEGLIKEYIIQNHQISQYGL